MKVTAHTSLHPARQRPLYVRTILLVCVVLATLTHVLKFASTSTTTHNNAGHRRYVLRPLENRLYGRVVRLDDLTEPLPDVGQEDSTIYPRFVAKSTTNPTAHVRRVAPVLVSQIPINTTCNSVGPSGNPSASIEQKMSNACSRKGKVSRTWVDAMLPPEECVKYSQASHERDRCLYVSDHQAPGVIVVYVCFGLIGSCLFILLFVACVRRRRQTTFVPRSGRSVGDNGIPPPKYRGIGYDGEDGRTDSHVGMPAADGVSDGWTRWLKRKSQEKSADLQALHVPAPRLPSLHLPKPTFATVRKMSGIAPEPYDRQQSKTSRGTGRLINRGSYI